MTDYHLPDVGSTEWYSTPLYPAVAGIDTRVTRTELRLGLLEATYPYSYAHINADTAAGPTGTWATFSAWTVDNSSGITYSAGVWTVPIAGRYRIKTGLSFVVNTTGHRGAQFLVNGVARAGVLVTPIASFQTTVQLDITFVMGASGTLAVQGWQSSGGVLNVRGDANVLYSSCQIDYVGP